MDAQTPHSPTKELLHHGWLAAVALLTHAAIGALAVTLGYGLERYIHWLYDGLDPKIFGLVPLSEVLQGGDALLVIAIILTGTISAYRILGRH